MTFADRSDAGRKLARAVAKFGGESPVVLAVRRGSVAVAAEVASALGAPLDLILVRKIGVPHHPELAMGAVVDGTPPVTVLNEEVIPLVNVTPGEFEAARDRELAEIKRRREIYLRGRSPLDLHGRTALVVRHQRSGSFAG